MNNSSLQPFGKTRLNVSRIGLGMAALGRPGYINLAHAEDLNWDYEVEKMEANAHRVLDFAWQHGIRYFDAARSYGKAEQFLGSWLNKRTISPAEVTVGSKWGYTYTADWQVSAEKHEVKEHTLPVLDRQWRESRHNLNQHLNIYHIHSATLDSGVLENEAVLRKLLELKMQGVIIGLSLSGSGQSDTLRKALQVKFDGDLLFGSVQVTFNLLEPSTAPLLQEASEAGMGIIVKEAVANGRLTSRNDDPSFTSKKKMLIDKAEELNTTIDALSIAFVLSHPFVSVVLSGATTADQFLSNLQAQNLKIPDGSFDNLVHSVKENPDEYWNNRKKLEWN
jgi:aryl-alcohol dehydrogenase-like predicted oxidoreductase